MPIVLRTKEGEEGGEEEEGERERRKRKRERKKGRERRERDTSIHNVTSHVTFKISNYL